ncbi:MAG: hypothetical protein HOI95_06000 [Chromatiales bacterium]|jgi:hypothetical protein|nr:hypothetical protein [Chromatiales bacterium]
MQAFRRVFRTCLLTSSIAVLTVIGAAPSHAGVWLIQAYNLSDGAVTVWVGGASASANVGTSELAGITAGRAIVTNLKSQGVDARYLVCANGDEFAFHVYAIDGTTVSASYTGSADADIWVDPYDFVNTGLNEAAPERRYHQHLERIRWCKERAPACLVDSSASPSLDGLLPDLTQLNVNFISPNCAKLGYKISH